QAELGGACGPLAPAAALLQGLCTLGLLGSRGVRGDTGSAHRVPGLGGELVEAVVRAGRVHCVRVTAGLTFGQLGPHATARGATAGVTGVTGITGVLRSAGLLRVAGATGATGTSRLAGVTGVAGTAGLARGGLGVRPLGG